MRYLVTGAAGFIGSHLTDTLITRGHEVTPVDCFTPYYDRQVKQRNASRFEIANCDLAVGSLDDLVANVDGIFHLAGQPGVRASWGAEFDSYSRHNILASQRLFETAASHRVRVVFASSSSVYGDAATYPTHETASLSPRSPYGVSKLACEHLAHAYSLEHNLDYVALRYFTVYGPRQRPDMAFAQLFVALLNNRPFVLNGDGSQSRCFTYITDAVEATRLAMEHASPKRIYNVGGGSETTLRDAITFCERFTGRPLTLNEVGTADGDVQRTSADTQAIRSDLAWTPHVDLETGLHAQWASLQHPHDRRNTPKKPHRTRKVPISTRQ